ncbi:MAG: D-alanyl-lipoteichoic acid biosynthesis protein DltD [Chloroflexi bacterium]|nr:D-alanyl-lipoteichoic acid biosynthesis protein DltD [Chloroflexota bacterium]
MLGPHLTAALMVVGMLLAALVAGTARVRGLESDAIHTMAPAMFDLKYQGSELQAEAFRQPDLLVVYGSSELEMPNPYHASVVFADYPTGFTVFPVGRGSTTTLVMLQDAAAVGDGLRGKKVVISVSPPWFLLHDRTPEFYAPNYSPLHLNALVFSTDLSFSTKQAAVRQLLQSPKMVHQDTLIGFAADRLASDSWTDMLLYDAVVPLGKLEHLVLQTQDVWETYRYIQSHPSNASRSASAVTSPIDWSAMLQQADAEQQIASNNNAFGFDNDVWSQKYYKLVPERQGQMNDAFFADNLQHTAEFTDLDLLLRGLRELGAQPLVLSQPMPGKYFDYVGVSPRARADYYSRLSTIGSQYGVPVVTFADHDEDTYFVTDPNSHLSREGWVYYDAVLDAFMHDGLGPTTESSLQLPTR